MSYISFKERATDPPTPGTGKVSIWVDDTGALQKIDDAGVTAPIGSGEGGVSSYEDLTDVPTEFPPEAHTHVATEVSNSTTVGRNVLTAVDAAAARTAIGAGTSSLAIGTSGSTAKVGDYQPTAANISDSTSTGRAVLTAASASAARTAISAGTSSLALGTSGSTAKAGDYAPTLADIPNGSVISAYWTGSAWPSRPTARTNVTVQWIGGTEGSPPSGGVADVDIWIRSAV